MPQHPHLVLVTSDSKGMSILPALMELTHLSKILQVPSSSAFVAATMAAMVRTSLSSLGGQKKACFGTLLGCPSSMRVEAPIPHVVFAPPIFIPEIKV
jgi:hypothetical protein